MKAKKTKVWDVDAVLWSLLAEYLGFVGWLPVLIVNHFIDNPSKGSCSQVRYSGMVQYNKNGCIEQVNSYTKHLLLGDHNKRHALLIAVGIDLPHHCCNHHHHHCSQCTNILPSTCSIQPCLLLRCRFTALPVNPGKSASSHFSPESAVSHIGYSPHCTSVFVYRFLPCF